jgi:hypothetical protein
MYYIYEYKMYISGGLDMLDSMDRWKIKYELFSSLAVCEVSGKAVHSFSKFKYNTYRHTT